MKPRVVAPPIPARRSADASRAAGTLLPRFDDPVYRVFVEGNLGEALLHLGETTEASELLSAALERALAGGYQTMGWSRPSSRACRPNAPDSRSKSRARVLPSSRPTPCATNSPAWRTGATSTRSCRSDRFGHAVGDRVLVTLAQLLRENTRGSDLVARIGGEEFVIALPEAPPARAHEVCERLRKRVAALAWGQLAEGLQVTLSVGLAHAPPYAQVPLLERADAAMYRAKQQGRNQVSIA
jgi:Diguanylate cyclase, GGDEF domain